MKSNLLSLEMMNGQERLHEALEMRGFLVKKEGPFLMLASGSSKRDLRSLKMLLNKLHIPIFWNGDRFQLLTNKFPVMMMKKITEHRGEEFPVSMEGYHFRWRAFVNRKNGLKVDALDLDPHIACFVKAVNEAGIPCLAGCDGHLKHAPNLQFSGVYSGAWFQIIQEQYLSEFELNYTWNVEFKGGSGSRLVASKARNERWDRHKIYEDTLKMAYKLKEHADEIKKRKASSFKRNAGMKEEAEGLRTDGRFEELVDWMERLSN
ncbi:MULTISPECIES: hypothetical protein [Pontibacillus]|uniref:Uncharacterized protein n=1 Tax=Pontibacillus chungwhensis TaxID=265426 RepID=A0ABY8V3S3_9BACI|nr:MULTISPECIES: hypothetical protein [Pontibacillus]MCD5325384.1 hypothetical protein [Pontibacillus sp. HN14]WIF98501.1 hypothetical protein QNI29_02195 [Pontibacillus chungwhensis]